ncbi:LytTR family transcriptional regulator DNA-binding domain-containing protein [Metabacillus fastidiosus]|uniref:LytTR family transcriptional regulator DNA-binding domain-containing protein n=1 Tax=Metabacillus fastidiosus TaxID=1458 RepID=UPI002DB7F6E0|nr:LytTR family transcriptional regulator DNA-binding domain-containing protein [Metabacillus fastidiosus]MEC2077606.1 LytTR family transcriptional regulator DNA-binding domain-containing protein [Metabacillus fastidiosus]
MSILTIEKLEKRVGNILFFPKIDLHIQKGEAVAIKCSHEIGKLLIEMIIGKERASDGEISILGLKVKDNYKQLCKKIGILSLNEGMYERLNAVDYLQFFNRLYEGRAEVGAILQKVGLWDRRKQKIEQLSFSERKRLQLARTILHNPDFIIMEEPDQNVDVETKLIIQKMISELIEKEKAVLITTSNFENAILMTENVYKLSDEGLKKIEIAEEDSNIQQDEPEKPEEEIIEEEVTPFIQPVRFEKIPAKVEDKIILFDPMEISFIESNEGISHLHVNEEVFPCTYTLNELFDRLQPFGFFRCHRSYIVNLQKVREVITWTRNSYSLILEDSKKSSIPLSKGKLTELKDVIGL